jgi:hypothetical protein
MNRRTAHRYSSIAVTRLAVFFLLTPHFSIASANPEEACKDSFLAASSFHALRVQSACQFKQAMLESYASIYQKEARLSNSQGQRFHSEQALSQCVQVEANNTAKDSPKSRLDWHDRMRLCSAQFQDTHLELTPTEDSAWISLGITLREIQGRYYIESTYPQALSWQHGPLIADSLTVGTEVESFNGRSIQSLIEELTPYIAGSSELYRKQEALRRLTERNFLYPESPEVRLRMKNETEISLKWGADTSSFSSATSRIYLKKLGFESHAALPWNAPRPLDPALTDLPRYAGYYDETPPLPESASERLATYYGAEEGAVALAFVQVDQPQDQVAHPFCYLQLATFNEDRIIAQKRRSLTYIKPLRKFLRKCQREQLPLVLDLRTNNGGYIDLGNQALSAVLPKRTHAQARGTWAYRESQLYREIESGYFEGQYWGENSIEVSPSQTSDRKVRGFSGKILALVTPYCISSCDRLAALLKLSGRAQLLGSPTNGTGAGFMDVINPSTGRYQSEWTDSSGALQAQIPDMLFGAIVSQEVPSRSGRPAGLFSWFRWLHQGRPEATEYVPLTFYGDESLIENRPTQPDLPFEIQPELMREGPRAWLERVQGALTDGS